MAVPDSTTGKASSDAVYVPLIWDVHRDSWPLPRYVSHFNEMLTPALKYGWPTIAQPSIYDSLPQALVASWSDGSIPVRTKAQVAKLERRDMPDELEDEVFAECRDADDAWVALGTRAFPKLASELSRHLTDIKKEYGKIAGVITWRANPSFREVTTKMGVPLIDLELSTIRRPQYRDTLAYFQLEPHFSTDEFDRRLAAFKAEAPEVPVLTRKEILTLFLCDGDLHRLEAMDEYEEFEFGVALSDATGMTERATGSTSSDVMLESVRRLVHDRSVLVRAHPEDPILPSTALSHDVASNTADYLMRCRRHVTGPSNVSFEAMLYGKTAYVLGPMPYAHVGITSLDYIDESVVDLRVLNWIVFGFLVPYDIMLSKDYLDWRMSGPSETEIYQRHFDYYMDKWGVSQSVLQLRGVERLQAFLRARAQGRRHTPIGKARLRALQDRVEHAATLEANVALAQDNDALRAERATLAEGLIDLDERQRELLQSFSWRATAPLRSAERLGQQVLERGERLLFKPLPQFDEPWNHRLDA